MSQRTGMRLSFFGGLRPFSRSGAVRDAVAGVTLASTNIPQVLGYTRIAATPVVTELYTVLLPLVAFAVFGSSRHLVVAADSATALPPLAVCAVCGNRVDCGERHIRLR